MTTPYTCRRTAVAPDWSAATRSSRFADMVTGEPALLDTRVAALWDKDNLYVHFWIDEPFIEAHQTERDSLIFLENDVALFIDGGDCYYEFEINPLGTIYEVFFIWQDAYSKFPAAEFDIHRRRALSFAGDDDRTGPSFWRGNHPRGVRWAFRDWDFPGLESSVTLDGYLNDRTRDSKGWEVNLKFPWAGMKHLANGRSLPPKTGDVWRMFFGRFEKLVIHRRENQPHPAWCLSPHGILDTHRPESWTPVVFD